MDDHGLPVTSRRNFLSSGLSAQGTASPLQYRVLGRTGLKVSSLGFGCMITSDVSVIQRAADLGINYFDTARVYQNGNNERMVGAALKGRRKDVILSTKSVGRSTVEAMSDLATSLRSLGTDYIDIWFLHNLSGSGQITPSLISAIQSAKKAGMIRFAGVSTHGGQAGVIRDAIQTPGIDVVMTSYNFAMEQRVTPLIESANRAGLGIVAMKVMAGGFRNPEFYPTPGKLRSIFKRPGALAAALKWVVYNPNVSTAIPSMVDTDQLEENFKAMSQPFTDQDVKALSAHVERIGPLYCRMCGGCANGCNKGLPVADVIRSLTYADGYGQFALGREQFKQVTAEVADVRCSDCSGCSVHCRHGVQVRDRVARAQMLFA